MKYKFNRRQIESVATFIASYLLLLILILWVLYRADDYFQWDIIPNDLQRFIEHFLITSIGGIVFISVVISLLLNVSLLSINIERLVDNKKGIKDEERSEVSIGKNTKRLTILLISLIVILIVGFKLWDKHIQNDRVENFISKYSSKTFLSELEDDINKINYKDTLKFNVQNQNYKRIEMSFYSPLGTSNEKSYLDLKLKYISICKELENINKETSLDMELILSYNDYWLGLDKYSGIEAYSDDNENILLTSKQEMLKRIFGNGMENVVLTHNENYDVYYRITNSKNYEFAIILNTKKNCYFEF